MAINYNIFVQKYCVKLVVSFTVTTYYCDISITWHCCKNMVLTFRYRPYCSQSLLLMGLRADKIDHL